jgi:hypothetical protein
VNEYRPEDSRRRAGSPPPLEAVACHNEFPRACVAREGAIEPGQRPGLGRVANGQRLQNGVEVFASRPHVGESAPTEAEGLAGPEETGAPGPPIDVRSCRQALARLGEPVGDGVQEVEGEVSADKREVFHAKRARSSTSNAA